MRKRLGCEKCSGSIARLEKDRKMKSRESLNRSDDLRISRRAAGAAAGLSLLSLGSAVRAGQATEVKAPPAAKQEDVGTLEAIVAAVYASISGPAGTRDWDRLRSLFHPSARLIPCFPAREENEKVQIATRVFTIEDFIKAIEPRVKSEGFYEQEIARRVERFGSVAHVFSTYESRHALEDPKPFTRGINSIQLFFDGKRWWTVTIFWDSEREGQAIPLEYLPRKKG
jgi:hypothetical protein